MNYPEYVKKILERIKLAGHEAFIVGGAVRDSLLGTPSHDYDITTSALPEETAEIFSDLHVIKTGIKHGTVTVVLDRHPIEITTYRVDGDYKDSRRPDAVSFTRNLADDLARRDFTVNAMAYNDECGVVDLFDGIGDLDKKIIRAVGEPQKRFTEDALRIMRAFRFASKLDFDIEPSTLEAAKNCRYGLANISAERKSIELEGILIGKGVKKALRLMHNTGVLNVIAPMISFDITRFDVVETLERDFSIRMAFCLAGQDKIDEYIPTLRLSSDEMLRKFMSECGDDLDSVLEIKKALGRDVSDVQERADVIRSRGDCLYLSQLKIDGRDLALLGISGKAVGKTLAALLDRVHADPTLNDRQALISIAKSKAIQDADMDK